AERFGDVPDVIVLLVGHVHRGRKLEGVDAHTGVVVHFAERFVLVHGDGESPVLHFGLGFLQGGLLLGRHLSAAASSALSLPAAGGAWSRPGSPPRSAAGSALSATRATGAARTAESPTALRGSACVTFGDIAHQLDGADAAIEAVSEHLVGA